MKTNFIVFVICCHIPAHLLRYFPIVMCMMFNYSHSIAYINALFSYIQCQFQATCFAVGYVVFISSHIVGTEPYLILGTLVLFCTSTIAA